MLIIRPARVKLFLPFNGAVGRTRELPQVWQHRSRVKNAECAQIVALLLGDSRHFCHNRFVTFHFCNNLSIHVRQRLFASFIPLSNGDECSHVVIAHLNPNVTLESNVFSHTILRLKCQILKIKFKSTHTLTNDQTLPCR